MAQQGPDVDIFGPNPGVVSQLVDRVGKDFRLRIS